MRKVFNFSTIRTLVIILGLGLLATTSFAIGRERLIYGDTPTWPEAICQDCNVVLISVTNLRYDHVSAEGYSRPTTPNIDALERESLDFSQAFSHSSWTLPEITTILTGLYPYQHGVMDRYDGSTLDPKTGTLMDSFRAAGYRSFAATGEFDHGTEFGLTPHFDKHYGCLDSRYPLSTEDAEYGLFNCSVPQATNWLKNNGDKKFFLEVQGFDAHCPFNQATGKIFDPTYSGSIDFSACLMTFGKNDPVLIAGQRYYPVSSDKAGPNQTIFLSDRDVSHLVALYDETITVADRQVGELIQTLKDQGLYDKTIIILTSEHGDMFGKYGRFMRGGPVRGTFYDDVLRIPLMIRDPKISPKKVNGLVSQVDLAPTILDLLGLPPMRGVPGRTIVPLVKSGAPIEDYTYAGSTFQGDFSTYFGKNSRIESIRSTRWKLIKEMVFNKDGSVDQTLELFDIQKDPEELHNLADTETTVLSDLSVKLASWSTKMRGSP